MVISWGALNKSNVTKYILLSSKVGFILKYAEFNKKYIYLFGFQCTITQTLLCDINVI